MGDGRCKVGEVFSAKELVAAAEEKEAARQ
jgi:hypothetical protein